MSMHVKRIIFLIIFKHLAMFSIFVSSILQSQFSHNKDIKTWVSVAKIGESLIQCFYGSKFVRQRVQIDNLPFGHFLVKFCFFVSSKNDANVNSLNETLKPICVPSVSSSSMTEALHDWKNLMAISSKAENDCNRES